MKSRLPRSIRIRCGLPIIAVGATLAVIVGGGGMWLAIDESNDNSREFTSQMQPAVVTPTDVRHKNMQVTEDGGLLFGDSHQVGRPLEVVCMPSKVCATKGDRDDLAIELWSGLDNASNLLLIGVVALLAVVILIFTHGMFSKYHYRRVNIPLRISRPHLPRRFSRNKPVVAVTTDEPAEQPAVDTHDQQESQD